MRKIFLVGAAGFATGLLAVGLAWAAGDLTSQSPVDVTVELGSADGQLRFHPADLTFETGKLYRLSLHNPSPRPHYFTAPGFAARVFTRKVQTMSGRGPDAKAMAEVKGTIREVEVHPGGTLEWWFVPIATVVNEPVICGIKDPDGKTHVEKGMVGSITLK
ncbi:MAG: hypothetical protein ABL908_02120 [Hyphomicrobium sp.]